MKLKKFSYLYRFLACLFLGSYFYLLHFYLTYSAPKQLVNMEKSTEKVTRVIDGDTFEIEGGIKVRLLGIDTPELQNSNKSKDCFAVEASDKLNTLLSGKQVELVKDISETDQYGRLLRYVYLNGANINKQLLEQGFAKVFIFPPDLEYSEEFLRAQEYAKEKQLGLWGVCYAQSSSIF